MKILSWVFAFVMGVVCTVMTVVFTIKISKPHQDLVIHDIFIGNIHYFVFQDKLVNYTSDSIEYANTVPTHEDSIELGGNLIDTTIISHSKIPPQK